MSRDKLVFVLQFLYVLCIKIFPNVEPVCVLLQNRQLPIDKAGKLVYYMHIASKTYHFAMISRL